MRRPRYLSGEEVKKGDEVRLHGELGEIEFVITDRTGDAATDWYLTEHPQGGIMVRTQGLGPVFLSVDSIDERLEFVGRGSTRRS